MKIALSNLTTKALGGLAQSTIKASTTGNYVVVANHPLLLKLIAVSADYDKVYSKLTFSGQGEAVLAADKKRDDMFGNLKAFVGGYQRLPQMPHAADAARIFQLLDRLDDGLTTLSYVEETAQMRKVISELQQAEAWEWVTNMGLADVVSDLKTAQIDFEDLYEKQAEANADLRRMPSASAIRKSLETALKDYFGLLESMKTVAGWEGLYHDVAEHVKAAR